MKALATGSYEVSSAKEGGAGARGVRYDGSAAGVRGDGNEALLETGSLWGEMGDTADRGRDGKSCESLSDAPDVFLRFSGGRPCENGDAPTMGDPARNATGIFCSENLLGETGEPICRGDGTPSIAGRSTSTSGMRLARYYLRNVMVVDRVVVGSGTPSEYSRSRTLEGTRLLGRA